MISDTNIEDISEKLIHGTKKEATIIVSKKRSFEAASAYKGKHISVLNFASATNPGGGVTRGASAKEECLCRISTLYKCISSSEITKNFHKKHLHALRTGKMNFLYNDDCIQTCGVTVFKRDTETPVLLLEKDWFDVDVISCAAPNLAALDLRYLLQHDKKWKKTAMDEKLFDIYKKRINRILNIARDAKSEVIILGAFGCGAFANPPELVAKAMHAAIDEHKYDFETIEMNYPGRVGGSLCIFYITGDTHGDFSRIEEFCRENDTTKEDVMIILGDAGINYWLNNADRQLKNDLTDLDITLFCVHGNHEARPWEAADYEEIMWNGGLVHREEQYPNILFAKDGEIYDFHGKKVMAIGGAYSVDKYYRLNHKMPWFDTEQPDEWTKNYVEQQLEKAGWSIDIILSHTVPIEAEPTWVFIPGLNQEVVDKSTEKWLQEIYDNLEFSEWYAGHYHVESEENGIRIMFEDYDEICEEE